jgi:hypothetical protein
MNKRRHICDGWTTVGKKGVPFGNSHIIMERVGVVMVVAAHTDVPHNKAVSRIDYTPLKGTS